MAREGVTRYVIGLGIDISNLFLEHNTTETKWFLAVPMSLNFIILSIIRELLIKAKCISAF